MTLKPDGKMASQESAGRLSRSGDADSRKWLRIPREPTVHVGTTRVHSANGRLRVELNMADELQRLPNANPHPDLTFTQVAVLNPQAHIVCSAILSLERAL